MPSLVNLNERAKRLADHLVNSASMMRINVQTMPSGARIIDCGVQCEGGLQAGLGLARTCLAGLAEVSLAHANGVGVDLPAVHVLTDAPAAACMASQYAGWQINVGKYFAMGSGPMRLLARKEETLDKLGFEDKAELAVGVLETRKLPDDDVIQYVCRETKINPSKLTLLVAPAASQAGTLQVVARSIETALHKLMELEFDLHQVVSACGSAPLPPVAKDEIQAIGRTNDAILYGGQVTLWVRADDEDLAHVGPKVPSSSSPDHGMPFADVFAKYDHDFYKIDPMLFSPALITLCNLNTGRTHRFGWLEPDVLRRSFFG